MKARVRVAIISVPALEELVRIILPDPSTVRTFQLLSVPVEAEVSCVNLIPPLPLTPELISSFSPGLFVPIPRYLFVLSQ